MSTPTTVELDPLEEHLLGALRALEQSASLRQAPPEVADLWRAQVDSRHADYAARWLQQHGRSFYTIGSAGHESNGAVALALRIDDPALLHYRSGAFYLARAAQAEIDGLRDIMLGVVAAAVEPIAGGRHKVFGRKELAVIPMTSTIASHLPRAVGMALAIDRATRLGVASPWQPDAIVMCSFGDASLNHATAQAALNTTAQIAFQGLPLPLLYVCEDNGLGISVPSPAGWVESALTARDQIRYEIAYGHDPAEVLGEATELAAWVRERRRPAVLHLRCVRYLSHAGADAEIVYRTPQAIRADYERDPILGTARWLVSAGRATGDELADDYLAARDETREIALEVAALPQMTNAEQVMAPLAPRSAGVVAERSARARLAGDEPLTLAQAITAGLAGILERHPNALLFGEDIAVKGGVYGVTRGLHARFGAGRVFDTLLDETSILGLALGAAVSGLLPIPEIQYLAYLHNAEDQLRGEAATLQFFSQRAYRNGMVIRIAGYGYQRGFGGHFHNDDAVGVLRDIPGLVIASPARPDDAAAMLVTCAESALVDGSVCVFLEPIALYHARDLHTDGDDGWVASLTDEHVPVGAARVYGDGADLTIVTWANGLHMSLRAARRLGQQGVDARVVDLRWLAPLPAEGILREASATGRVLVVDETRRTGGVSEGVIAELVDAGFDGRVARVTSKDSFVPLGDAARLVLVSEDEIEVAALDVIRR
ncbi:MAG TPA: transketolase C-terminal domain-containing protein [Gaiellaceae bacterium]|nr:transketolase C-terminal domain-containing protein [Gaiellaceae bacterium]